MYNINDFFKVLNDLAPLSISHDLINLGEYDNSGILVNSHREVKKVLFSLDLSNETVKRAKRLGVDTVVTHHPAIYSSCKNFSQEVYDNASVMHAIENKLNVISMHLNLDMASGGIDDCLAYALGAKSFKSLFNYLENATYGREFSIEETSFSNFVASLKKTLKTDKVMVYGNKKLVIDKVASFCGGGSAQAVDSVTQKKTSAQVIVTSDLKHHQISMLVESGKCVVMVAHYAAENYGFSQFFEKIKGKIGGELPMFYFEDKRFL